MSTITTPSTPPSHELPMVPTPPMSAWDRLKDAQTALMQREAEEASRRRARRKSNRESIVVGSPTGWTLSDHSNDSPLSSPHRLRTAPSSILRRSTSSTSPLNSPPSSSPSLPPLDSYTALPKRISRCSSSISFTPSDFGPILLSTKIPEEQGLRRRSSRVRFSDESNDAENGEDSLELPSPSIESGASFRRLSAIDGLRDDIARSSRILRLDTTTLSILTGTMRSDEVDVTLSPMAISATCEASASNDGFAPQPLPYPKMSRKLSRLSSSNMYAVAQLDSLRTTSMATPPTSPVREALNRLSLSCSPGRSIVISRAPSAKASHGSIASTLASTAEAEPETLVMTSEGNAEQQSTADAATPSSVSASSTYVQEGSPEEGSISSSTTTHTRETSGASSSSDKFYIKKHHRSASIVDDILNFPLPPSRQIIERVPADISEQEVLVRHESLLAGSNADAQQAEDSGSGSSEICLDTPRPCSGVSTLSSPPIVTDSPPPSPTLAEMLFVGRSKPEWDSDAENIVNSPLLDAAVSSGILSPNSRLLKPASPLPSRSMPKRSLSSSSQALRSGLSFTRGKGWSGSESEEEEFGKAIQSIVFRKNNSRPPTLRSASANSPSTSFSGQTDNALHARHSARKMDRLSQLSATSSAPSSVDSIGPLTPHEAEITMLAKAILPPVKLTRPLHSRHSSSHSTSSGSTIPGDFPWGGSAPSSPTGSVSGRRSAYSSSDRNTFYQDLNQSLQSVAMGKEKEKRRKMPKPTRKVEGWGRPEILLEDVWNDTLQRQTLWNSSDEEMEWHKSQPSSSGGTPKGKVRQGIAPKSSDLSALGLGKTRMEEEQWGSLLDEKMPEIGLAM